MFLARYANWHRDQVESLVSVGSNPTRATRPNLVPSSSGEDACLTNRIAQVRVLPGRLPKSRSAGVPAAHLLGREGDRVRFSGGPSSGGIGLQFPGRFLSSNGLLVQRDDTGIARRSDPRGFPPGSTPRRSTRRSLWSKGPWSKGTTSPWRGGDPGSTPGGSTETEGSRIRFAEPSC